MASEQSLAEEFPDLVRAVNKAGAKLCSCRGCFAGTRPVVLDGRAVLFCSRCPTPLEIEFRRSVVQDEWTASEERRRRWHVQEPYELPRAVFSKTARGTAIEVI